MRSPRTTTAKLWTAGLLAALWAAWMMCTPASIKAQESGPDGATTVSGVLAAQLAAGGDTAMLVVLDAQLDPADVLALAAVAANADRTTRADVLYRQLTAHATADQAELRAWLAAQGVLYRPFYLVNMIRVVGDAELAHALARHPGVARLEADPEIRQSLALARPALAATVAESRRSFLALSWLHEDTTPASSTSLPWGLTNTRADQVWALGYTGQNIVVASQDTGVDWEHPALQPGYRGWDGAGADHAYNWFDAWGIDGRPATCSSDPQVPCDDNGHGTHTVGTMNGPANDAEPQVGMAPDAEWIGCRNMRNGFGTPSSYAACFEFFLAPYPQGGDPFTDGDPTLAPHIVNNSWGCPGFEGCDATSLRQVVETVRAAGIFVIASAGNSGPACSTVNTPIAIHDATFTVGATNQSNTLATFSSRGPVTVDGSGRAKPDISAPGVGVYSTYLNDGYTNLQGTSMASPHVAGAAALLWSAAPALIGQIDQSEQVLIKSATPVDTATCAPDGVTGSPNALYGFGRLDALAAVNMAQAPARAEITVESCAAAPVDGAQVHLTDAVTGYAHTGVTSSTGTAVFDPLFVRAGGDVFTATVTLPSAPGTDVYAATAMTLTRSTTTTVRLAPADCTASHQLDIVRRAADPIRPGESISFTVTVTNTGSSAWNAYPLTVAYDPVYLAYADATPAPTTVDTATGLITWSDAQAHAAARRAGELDAGESLAVTATLIARTDTTLLPDSLTTVTGGTTALAVTDGVRIYQPTAAVITDVSLRAQGVDVVLTWRATTEAFIQGYRLYGVYADGVVASLTPTPIPAQGVDGAVYEFVDTTRHNPLFSSYLLDVLESDGSFTQIGMGSSPIGGRFFLPMLRGAE